MSTRLYFLTYAVINWLEATAMLLTLGQWSPNWVMRFAARRAIQLAKARAESHRVRGQGDDTERLDWLINRRGRVSYNYGHSGEKEWFFVYVTCPTTGNVSRCDSPARNVTCAREAIDIAMGSKE